MYSKFFIYSVIICTIPLILMDIAFIYSMLTGGYEGNLKATILAVIVFHILLYLLSHKQVKLLIQAFKRNGFREFIFLFIGITVSLIINPEIIEDENDIYFFIASYITILVFYFGWGYVYRYLGRKRKQ